MPSSTSYRLIALLLVGTLLLSACQMFQPTTPTRDADQLYTQVASTMIAALMATSEARPSNTPAPTLPISTPRPTQTTAEPAIAALSTATLPETAPPHIATAITPVPGTASAGPQAGERAVFVYLSPGTGFNIQKNAAWDLALNIKNEGSTTWTRGYFLGFERGEQMGSPGDYYLTKDVGPGETYTFVFKMRAPDETGAKRVTWAFRDDKGRDLLYIDFDVNVTN